MSIDKPGHHTTPTAERFRRPLRTSPSRACVSSRCAPPRTAGRRASAAARLCANCVDRLRTDLRKLLDAYRESDHALTPTAPRPSVRVGGTKTAKGIILDQRAMDLRTRMTETLASWARLVVDEARTSRPRQREVVALVDFLSRHIEWLAAHPAAADFDEEVRQLLESCRTVLGPAPAQRTPIGVCPETDCHSTLHVIRQADAAAQHPRHVACDAGHALPPQEWLRYMGGRSAATARNDRGPLAVAEVRS
ncbi:hypothetical protein ABTY20_22555 [Streptomyces sp. NPDC126497]|uniref:hypothetical protein n=1 Tax=Streptomyces sp. NPDC126497 TaxID=3155313 RepID=UPI00331AF4C2